MLRVLDYVALILLIIGGLDLGVVGVFNRDPIIDLFSDVLVVAHILFFIIGLAAIYLCVRLGQLVRTLQPPV